MARLAVALAAVACLVAGCATMDPGADTSARPRVTPVHSDAHQSTTPQPSTARSDSTQPSAPRVVRAPPTAAAPSSSKPKPPPNHCAGNRADQLVLVSITAQHAWMCEHTRTVYSVAITSGASVHSYNATPTGHYEIQGRNRNSTLTLSSGAQYDVKYWIPFDAPLYGFHDSSWQHFPYGSPKYRTKGSHGCVHLPLAGMKFLYNWAHVGASVLIRA